MEKHFEKKLFVALCISLTILFSEVIGSILSRSLALLSDAGHVFTDSLALSLSLIAAFISRKPSDRRATFGYQRIGLLAAVFNGLSLLGISIFIFVESYKRFVSPPEIESTLMLIFAAVGLAGNITMALILSKGHHDLNIKSAWMHIMGDLLASIGVIVAAAIIYITGLKIADPIASVIVGILILSGGIRVVVEALRIFLEMAPPGFDIEKIKNSVLSIPEIKDIHDIHLWSISHGSPSFSAHISVSNLSLNEVDDIRKRIESVLTGLGIKHTVLQLECSECDNRGELYCSVTSQGVSGVNKRR